MLIIIIVVRNKLQITFFQKVIFFSVLLSKNIFQYWRILTNDIINVIGSINTVFIYNTHI